jgi:signal transduction histidine kinase/DNA-binding NarL/FixJ family response regulator
MKIRNSLKQHLTIGILLIFLFTQGTFGLLNYMNLKVNFENDIEERSDALLSLVNANFEHFMEIPIELITQMKGFIPDTISDENSDSIQTYICTIESVYSFIDHIKIIDRDGFLVLQSPVNEDLINSNFKNESFFLNPPTGDEVLWTNVYLSELTHRPTIAMSVNLENYILVADLNLESLHTELFREYSESVTTFSLLDQYGNYLYDNDHTKVEQRLSYPRFEKVKEISGNNSRYVFSDKVGNKMILAKKLGVQNAGYLVVEQDYDHLQNDIREFNLSLVISIAILFILSLIIISFLMKKIMNDFYILSSHSKALSEGAYDGNIANCQYVETQLIANEFNKMGQIIINREKSILEVNNHLEDLVGERTKELKQEISDRIHVENELDLLNKELEKRIFDRTLDVERANHTLEEINAQLEEEIHEHTNTLMMLRDKEGDLEYALNIAREASLAKSQFLANMSHEIRTPMNGILGMINVLLLSTLNVTQREYLATIHSSTNTLMIILNDILDYSKIEAGKVTLRKELFSIDNALKDLRNLFISSATHKEIELAFQTDTLLPEYVLGDETRLRQVLSNLIGNAIKFTNHGCVKISSQVVVIESKQVIVRFSIADTGIGITKVEQDHIFDRFEQGSNNSNAKTKGTGLGLAITKMLVELMGGKIELNSDVNLGSTFIVEVPFEMGTGQHSAESYEQNDTHQSKLDLRGINILVAEDDETSAFVMLTMFKNLGASIEIAENGKIAVEKAHKKVYDLVLMDVNMPLLDGLNATKQIRQLKMLSNVGLPLPIIAITAFAAEGDRERCLSFGVDDYVTKPVDFKVLYNKIQNMFEEGRMLAPFKIQPSRPEEESISLSADYETVINALCEASGFDRETAEYVIQTYITQSMELVDRLKPLINSDVFDENLQEIGNLLHKLKGSSGNVRANKIMQLASLAESLCIEKNQVALINVLEEITGIIAIYNEKI